MEAAKRKARRDGVDGVLDPHCTYTIEGVFRATGIGEGKLDDLRRDGKLKAYVFGKRVYYRGDELQAAIFSVAEEK